MNMRVFILASLFLAMFAASADAQAPAQAAVVPEPSAGATRAVYEAVARYQISTWQISAHTYCFRLEGRDADKQFLKSLKPFPVKPESDCAQGHKTFSGPVIDKHTKKSAVIFGLGGIVWRSPTQADVQGAYFCGTQCMAGGTYHAVLDGSQWKITGFKPEISNF